MERFYKCLWITVLLSVSISASVFMVLEAGNFFQTLYAPSSAFSYMGYWAAGLAEIFMGVMAAVWLPDIKKNKKNMIHPGNFLFKFLLVLLFIATSGGAALNLLVPILEKVEGQKKNSRIISLLKSQVKDSENSLNMFIKEKQKLNSIVTIRNQLKTKNELKKYFQTQELAFKLWIEAIFVIFVRFVLQLANLSCVWLLGWLYRGSNKASTDTKLSDKAISVEPKLNCRDFWARGEKSEEKEIIKKSKGQNIINLSRDSELKPKFYNNKNIFFGDLKAISNRFSKKQGKQNSEEDTGREEILNLRREISNLLRDRNHNVPLAAVCGIIGEKESEMKNIINLNTKLEKERLPKLKNILKKIERLRERNVSEA